MFVQIKKTAEKSDNMHNRSKNIGKLFAGFQQKALFRKANLISIGISWKYM